MIANKMIALSINLKAIRERPILILIFPICLNYFFYDISFISFNI